MRFAAVPPRSPHQRVSTFEKLRKLIGPPDDGKAARPTEESQAKGDLPADLDQRVRLIGEW